MPNINKSYNLLQNLSTYFTYF